MAYAAVVSLKQTLVPFLDSARSGIKIPNSDLKLIYKDLCYLKSFFDKISSLQDRNSVEELEKEIKDVVQNTQDLIESHISDLFYSGSESSISEFSWELLQVKETLSSFTKMLMAEEDCHTEDQQPSGSFAADVAVSSRIDFDRNSKIVGSEDELMRLQHWLFEFYSDLEVISIVGMAGIGKTALAKEVYLDPRTIEHFDIRLFVKIGLEYQLKELLLRLVGQLGFNIEEMIEKNDDELREYLYRYLKGRRYLVVLDDMWNIGAWSELQLILPADSNGSAVILTTRLTNVVRGALRWSQEHILQKRFLNDDESWDLLREMVFSEEMCPSQLEKVGKTIAKNLEGLPLAIVEIGKLLSIREKTVENWMAVAENINSCIQETTIPKILNPSYTQLPQHLKACFLYLALFPPNYNIPTSQLIKLWVSEGFIEPVTDRSLEEKAEEYLEDIVSRGLVIVHQLNIIGRIKTCRIHFVLQNLCVREARQEKICHIVSMDTNSFPEGTKNQRRLGIHSNVVLDSEQVQSLMESVSAARSVLYVGLQHQHPSPVYLRFRWLRVLLALQIGFCKFPDEVLKLVRLRYLAITCHGELPSSISRLWNLEVLVIHRGQSITSTVVLPLEIWKLFKLRHLECIGSHLPDPSTAAMGEVDDGCGDFLVLKKLLTLSGVSARSCTEGVLARMPNLRKLRIWFEATDNSVEISCLDGVPTPTHLHHLESFKCVVMNRGLQSQAASSLVSFPSGLRKLSLSGCGFPWEHMMSIAVLPHLKVLKLRWHAFCGRAWESFEGGFCSLKFLLLEDLDVKYWLAEVYHFPILQHLLIRRCNELEEIPSEIGDIPTLEMIEVDDCSKSVIKSACRIKEEQEELGNDYLQVRIHSSCDDKHQIENHLSSLGFVNKILFN